MTAGTISRLWIARRCLLGAVGMLCLAGYDFRPGSLETAAQGAALFLAAIPLVAAALFFGRESAPAAPTSIPSPARTNVRAVLTGVVLLTILAQANGLPDGARDIPVVNILWNLSQHLQMLLYVVGAGLVVWGFGGGSGAALRRVNIHRPKMSRTAILLLGILGLALVVRVANLEFGGTHRFIDEMHYASAVTRMWDAGNNHILNPFSTVTAFSWFYPYLQYWSVALVGPGLVGLRLVSVGFGVLTVAAIYFLAIQWFDRRTALLAAAILATFPPEVQFSRIAINNIADPLFGVLALAFLARGLKSGRRMDYALAGACLALTQYFYEGGRLLFPALAAGFLVWAVVVDRRRLQTGRPLWAGIVALVAVFVVMAAPYYYTLLAQSDSFAPRLQEMVQTSDRWGQLVQEAGGPAQAYLGQALTPLWGLVQKPETSWFYANGQQVGFVPPAMVPLFLLGAAAAISRIFTPGGGLLVLWVLATAAGNSLIIDNLSAPRYVVVFPALALAMGLGLRDLLRLLLEGGMPSRRRMWLSGGIAVGLVIGITAYQTAYFFGVHLPRYDAGFQAVAPNQVPYKDTDDALFRAVLLPPNTAAHIIGRTVVWDLNIQTMTRFYGRQDDLQIDQIFPQSLTPAYFERMDPAVNQAFFIEPEDSATYTMIRQYFELEPAQFSPYNVPVMYQYVMYYAPLGSRLLQTQK